MTTYDANKSVNVAYSTSEHVIEHSNHDVVADQDEFRVFNDRFQKDWDAFNRVPKLKSAIIMKGIWTIGKGYNCSPRTKVYLDHINGNGKQTFRDLLFSAIITKQVARDAYLHIVKSHENKSAENPKGIINLIMLDPANMVQIYNKSGQIIRYELLTAKPKNGVVNKIKNLVTGSHTVTAFEPDEIFHLTNHQFAGETHGRSVPEMCEKIILADDENFDICRRVAKYHSVPFIIFTLGSDDATTKTTIKANIKDARETGDDMILTADPNILKAEPVPINPSTFLMEWRNQNNEEFYRAVGMPMVLFGGGGTEANGKTSYLGHETVFEHDQRYIEEQIREQLGFDIDLNSPASLLENLQMDEQKDAQNGLTFQPNDMQAGSGRDAE